MQDQTESFFRCRSNLRLCLRGSMVLCVIGMAWAASMLYLSNQDYVEGDAAYTQIRLELAKNDSAKARQNSLDFAPNDFDSVIDFAALTVLNQDTVAWITAKDSVIDYPVVQAEDNDRYLTHLFNGDKNKLGCLFLDFRNSSDFSDKNSVIYGHNMKDGSMFSTLTRYQEQSYYESHPVMQIYTPRGEFTVEFFAGIVASGSYEFVRFDFLDDADFLTYTKELTMKSTFQSDVQLSEEDQIITLCTCSYEFDNARYALFGKLTAVVQSD